MRNSTFFPFGLPPISNLEKRVAIQRRALAQAEADLAEARGERGIAEASEELDGAPSVYISAEHRRMHLAAERRRRGLGADPIDATATADMIVKAHRKATGEKTVVELDPEAPKVEVERDEVSAGWYDLLTGRDSVTRHFSTPVTPKKTTAELIIEAHRKANGGRK
jgi:hypothetical protein